MRLRAGGDAPVWMARILKDIEDAIRGPRDVPDRLQAFADAASLPPADKWPCGLVYVKDIEMVAVSTGSSWLRLDTGATI